MNHYVPCCAGCGCYIDECGCEPKASSPAPTKSLESEIEALRAALSVLAERVRIDAVAEEFLAGAVEWRVGDCFTDGYQMCRIDNISSEGKWTCGGVEARPKWWANAERLYSHAEVAEIVAKVRK